MATTSLFVAQSSYSVGVRDTHFHVRGSTPDVGGVHEGHPTWVVQRGGVFLAESRRVDVLDYQWLLQDGDIVWATYVDRDGNAGDSQTHTAVVTQTVNLTIHIDAINGLDTNTGLTPQTAVRTSVRAATLMNNLSTNQVGALLYSRGQVHLWTNTIWDGTSGGRRRVIFGAYGLGARPILRRSVSQTGNYSAIIYGNESSVALIGIELDGQQPAPYVDSQVGIECRRTSGPMLAQDLLIDDCIIRRFSMAILMQGDQTPVMRDGGAGDFVCVRNSTILECGSGHILDGLCSRYVSLTGVTFGSTFGQSGPNTVRVSNWYQFVVHNTTWDTGNVASLRLQTGRSASGGNTINESANGSLSDCTYFGKGRLFSAVGLGRPAPDSASIEGTCRDIRFVRWKMFDCRVDIGKSPQFGNNTYDRIQFWNCSIGGSFDLMGGPAAGQIRSLEVIDCSTTMSGALVEGAQAGPSPAFQLFAAEPSRYATGSIKIRGHTAIWPTNSADFQRRFLYAPRLTQAQLYPLIDSNYVHCAHAAAGVPLWTDTGFNLGTQLTETLAAWQAATTNDDNSTVRASSTLNVVNTGTYATNQVDMDLSYTTGAGVANNLGFPRAYALDGAGKIRFSPPDPGPFEFGATAEPSLPTIGTNHPIRVRNLSSSRYVGWTRIITDATVTDPYGVTNGTQWVRGSVVGKSNRAVDLFVDLTSGEELVINNLIANAATPPAAVVPVAPFSGLPQLNGQNMTQISSVTDGQSTQYHFRHKIGLWTVDMWAWWYPNEPWIQGEVLVTFGDSSTAVMTENWPGYLLTWGGGILTILGRAAAQGSLIDAGTRFDDAMGRGLPIFWTFLGAIRDAQDVASLQALDLWGIVGHGIKNYHPDGPANAYLNTGGTFGTVSTTTWAGVALAGTIERLHNWEVSTSPGWSIKKTPDDSGEQGDHMFVRGEPMTDIAAVLPTYLEAFTWVKKPNNYRRADGTWVTSVTNPLVRLNNGRVLRNVSADDLGKTTDIISIPGWLGWEGPGNQHWLEDGLRRAIQFRWTPLLQAKLSNQANLYLLQRFPDIPTFSGGAAIFSNREVGFEAINVCGWDDYLTDRTLAATVVARFLARCSPSGPQGAIHSWITNPPLLPGNEDGSVFHVWTTTGSSAVPIVPGQIPWQQVTLIYGMDYARRRLSPSLDWVLPFLINGARRVLDDVWTLEFDPAENRIRWVEYERVSLQHPQLPNQRSRSAVLGFDHKWFPPLIPFVLQNTGSFTQARVDKASAIWAQLQAESIPHDKSWFPPNQVGGGAAATLVSIAVDPNPASQSLGYTRQFTAIGTYSDGTALNLTESVNWTTSAGGVATVSNTAGSRGLASTVSVGSATITATEPTSLIAGGATLNVTAAVLVSIAVTPASATIEVDDTQQFTATGTYSNGSTSIITSSVTWVSSSRITGLIDPAGLATGLAAGATQITASLVGIVAAATLVVTDSGEPPIIIPTGSPGSLVTRRRAESPGFSSIPLGRILDPDRP